MDLIWIDWIVLAVIGFGVWRGVESGFFQQAATLVGLVGGFLLAAHLMPAGGRYLSSAWGLAPRIAPLVAFIGMFLVIVLAVILGARFFEYLVGVLHIGFLDRAMGGLFGALQTVLLLSVLFWFTGQFDWPSQEARSRSALIEPIESFAGRAWDWTRRMWPSIDEFYDRMGEELEQRAVLRVPEGCRLSVRRAQPAPDGPESIADGPGLSASVPPDSVSPVSVAEDRSSSCAFSSASSMYPSGVRPAAVHPPSA